MNTVTRFAAAAIMVTTGLGLASVGTATKLTPTIRRGPSWDTTGARACPSTRRGDPNGTTPPATTRTIATRTALIHNRDYFGPGPFQRLARDTEHTQ